MVHVKDKPAGEVFQAIAVAVDGDWNENGRLVIDEAARLKRRAEESKETTKALTEMLNEASKQVQKLMPLTVEKIKSAYAEREKLGNDPKAYQAMRYMTPQGILTGMIAPYLNPSQMTGVSVGDRLVFSTHPNSRQLPLKIGAVAACQRVAELHQLYAQAFSSTPKESEGYETYMVQQWQRTSKNPVATVQIVVTRVGGPSMTLPMIEVRAIDPKGYLVFSYGLDTYGFNEFEKYEEIMKDGEKELQNQRPLSLSDEAKAFMRFMERRAQFYMGEESVGAKPTLQNSPEQTKILMNPHQFEPLGYGLGELLHTSAVAGGLNTVCNLGDDLFMIGADNMPPMTPKMLDGLLDVFAKPVNVKDIKVRQMNMSFEGNSGRANRNALATIVSKTAGYGVPRLPWMFEYVKSRSGSIGYMGVDRSYITAASQDNEAVQMLLAHPDLLGLLSRLSDSQMQALRSTGKLSILGMTPEQRSELEKLMMRGGNAMGNVQVENYVPADSEGTETAPDAPPPGPEGSDGVPPPNTDDFVPPKAFEITDYLAKGFSRDDHILLKVDTVPLLIAYNNEGEAKFTDPESYGVAVGYADNPEMMRYYGPWTAFKEFRVGKKEVWNIQIIVGGRPLLSSLLQDFIYDPNSKRTGMQGLPEEMRKTIEQAIHNARMIQEQTIPGVEGGGTTGGNDGRF